MNKTYQSIALTTAVFPSIDWPLQLKKQCALTKFSAIISQGKIWYHDGIGTGRRFICEGDIDSWDDTRLATCADRRTRNLPGACDLAHKPSVFGVKTTEDLEQ
ncbi:hypothetical protein CC1G_04132 [Coprinopsis cinerea okayama7|uniref:Uncharacterized protein n=1 Tax=Coprinopsis cinerea (strain Okayama-7 / 130 / ATCC MYA-4618 / FGSC 9003) TaxID=240176 RepID=A8NW37_COPC7|nr:hypothetical protein CC1G_04132 [Coprinopsis cinerea okayama7\|eukprot:XP_001836819.2 hypothetical protein CC1G_04132 [Coprinopsis cinerea okayama7\